MLVVLVPALRWRERPRPPIPTTRSCANPFGEIVQWFNVEYERKLAPAITLGGSASHFGELEQSDATIMLRWYPQQKALDGFYLGARAGAYGFKTYTYDFRSTRERNEVVPGAGIELGYNWLLGPKQNISVGTGFSCHAAGGTVRSVPSVLPSVECRHRVLKYAGRWW